MKKIIPIFLFLMATSVFSQSWKTNFPNAKELARKQNKKIILVFQGSDWCAPCKKLDKEVWSTLRFKKYAENNFVMVQVDFPRRKKNRLSKKQIAQNKRLAERFNKRGYFPFVVVLDSNGKKIGETSYKKMKVEKYIQHLESL